MNTSRTSLRQAVNLQCKACIYDPLSPGAWREQVAACTNGGCALFDVRPVPRDCTKGGGMCPAAIGAVRAKLDVAIARKSRVLSRQ